MLKYTSMNLEKKRELNKAHEANARAAKKANLKRKLEGSPTPTVSGVPSADGSSPAASKEAVKGNRWVLFPFPFFLRKFGKSCWVSYRLQWFNDFFFNTAMATKRMKTSNQVQVQDPSNLRERLNARKKRILRLVLPRRGQREVPAQQKTKIWNLRMILLKH